MSSPTEELALLERVFLRVGSADSDEQLESAINKFLIPVLLKLSSPNEGVRKKVMELLVHINKRVKRQPTIQLPVEALLAQYRDPKASSFFINFSILYIKLGFPRLPLSKQEELAPVLLLAIEGKPKIHQDSLLLLLTIIIGNIKIVDIQKQRKLFQIDEKPELMKHFSSFMLDMLLLPYVYISPNEDGASSSVQGIQAPPGMSENGFKRVTSGDMPMTPERLEQTKLGIVKFLATGVLLPNDIICHLIIAAADTRFTVANLADAELKKVVGSVDWSSVAVASRLFYIYLGSPEVPAEKRNLIPPANRVMPANTRIRIKILPYLSRLEKDAILFPGSVQVIFNSLYDSNTNAKLKLQALNFALAIVNKSEIQCLRKMAGMLYTGLLKLVWNKEESEQLRVVGYTIIGQIVKRLPGIINKNLIELQAFFENLTSDSAEIRSAVRDSMLTMLDAFKLFMKEEQENPKSTGQFFMLALLSAQIQSNEPMARFVAVKYIAAAFNQDHVESRYLLLLSSGDSNSDVSSIAHQSIYSFTEEDGPHEKKLILPDFREMCDCIYNKAMSRLSNANQRVTIQNHVLPFNDTTFAEVINYLRLCLAKSAGVDIKSKELTTPGEFSPLIGQYISELYQSNESVVNNYLSLVEMYLSATSSLVPLNCLLEVVRTSPNLFAQRYAEKIQWVMNFLNSLKEDIREIASLFFSIISIHTMNDDQLSGIIQDLMKKLNSKSLESQHSAILSLGYLIEQKILKSINENQNFENVIQNWDSLGLIISELAKQLESTQTMLVSASCIALGQIAKVLPLPLPDESNEALSKKKIMQTLLTIVNSSKLNGKVKERAIQACGLLCLGEKFPFMKELVEELLSTAKQTKDIDLHFSLADALILCLEGVSSSEKYDNWQKQKSQLNCPMPEENLDLLHSLMDKMVACASEPHPNMRQAVCVFFLSILKRLSHLSAVTEKLSSIQYVFMELLSENNELVQDMSSKGLALIYEYSTEENKKKLVDDLLDQLLSGKRAVQQVTGSTKLFEEGQLGVSPAGGNLSTYKELCSLASDLNQPDLIYKFMHLANHNAVWNSKKGAAFGFQTIVMQANDQLNEYLPKIIPRLYRYQFDPTPRIQHSMANIWRSIVKDTQKTIDKYFHEILDDLLINLTSNQWRVRISCCQALADFFRGNRSLLDAKSKLPELWKSLFRVMDDVHEGTRLAAQTTGKILANHCIKLCDNDNGRVNPEMLDISLKVFLSELTNPVAEVKNLCLHSVSQLVSCAGPSLKPSLPTLIPSLLEAAGELESVGLSYLSAQYGAQAQAQEVIDVVRANVAKSHYTTQTVTKCIQNVDVEILSTLVPKIVEIMKNVSFGSRIACGHVIVLLAHHLGKSMEQYTGKFLSALVNGLLDRNATVRKTYASVIGQIIHTAKSSTVEKLLTKLSNWYFEKEDANVRTAIGCTLQAIAHYNGELLKEDFSIVIPLIFYAMHGKKIKGEDNSSVELWEDVWNEVSPGTESGIKQYINEILTILESALNSPSWNMKAQGGRCIVKIAVKVGDQLESEHRDRLINLTLTALQGKTFPGKEELLMGLAKMASRSANSLAADSEKCQAIVEAIIRECGKSEPLYKRHGIEALGDVLEGFQNVDYFQRVYEITRTSLKQLEEEIEGETANELAQTRNEKFKTIEVIYETLGKSWPKKKETQIIYQETLLNECLSALESSPRDVQVAILCAFRSYIEKLHYFNSDYVTSAEEKEKLQVILQKTTEALHFSLGIPKHARLRKEALNIVYSLGNKLKLTGRNEELKNLTDLLRGRLQELEKDSTPEVRTRLMDLKQLYQN